MMLRNGLIRLTIIKRIKYLFQYGKIKMYQAFLRMNLRRIITEFVALRPKTYSYLDDNCSKQKS